MSRLCCSCWDQRLLVSGWLFHDCMQLLLLPPACCACAGIRLLFLCLFLWRTVGWTAVPAFCHSAVHRISLLCSIRSYVDQLEGVDSQQTAIQVVVQADTAAQRAQHESEALEASKGCRGGKGAALLTVR